ncbi:uncharacterized protein LOC129263041 [Lytechinus pictus]|uniref:uncharacterized protein LOC129263041 n=1 Tax=Lytechinus pictus TaxID=7653 RepID=UPI0030BA0191
MATVKLDWIFLILLLVHCGDNFVNGIITYVRLVGGPTLNKGTIQVMQDGGPWETTCGINIDIDDVIVICKQLGYTGANRAIQSTPYGQDSTSPKIVLSCNGGEDSLAECQLFEQQGCSSAGAASCHGDNYRGCHGDLPADRVLRDGILFTDPNMTIPLCIQYCNAVTSSYYVYAGVENADECFCGEFSDCFIRHGIASDRDCQIPCRGDSTESCGGLGYISVFAINTDKSRGRTIPSTAPTTTTLSSAVLQPRHHLCVGVGVGEGVIIMFLIVIIIVLVLYNLRMRKMMEDLNKDQKTQILFQSPNSTDKDTGFYHDVQDVRKLASSSSPDEQRRDSVLDPNVRSHLPNSYMTLTKDSNNDEMTQYMDLVQSSSSTDKHTSLFIDIVNASEQASPDDEVVYSSKIYK